MDYSVLLAIEENTNPNKKSEYELVAAFDDKKAMGNFRH
jgi:hypothetical protein